MKLSAALANGSWLAASMPAWIRFRRGIRHPEATQLGILARLLAEHESSQYGRAHGFARISSYAQFKERVPVIDYDTIAPWIERIMRGESSVLTRDPVTRLVPTSGSTGGAKLIPFTAGLQREFNAAIGPWLVDLCRTHPAMTLGPAYWSISPAIPPRDNLHSAVPIGFEDDSAYLGGIRQRLVESTFAAPSSLRLIGDIDTFRYATLLCLLRQPELRFISVWHPSFLTLMLDALPLCWDELIGDVAHGGCARAKALPEIVKSALRGSPQIHRARELEKLGPANVRAIWPHLQIVSCWGDAQSSFALHALERRLPWVSLQPKGLLATEAFVTIPFEGRHPVTVTSHFFEFMDAANEPRLAHELRLGETYTVIVTTGGGLWRYRLGDQVQVEALAGATPSLRFIGREGSVVDLCGEKLAEPFVTKAIATACHASGIVPAFAMLAPEQDASGRFHYTLFVEMEDAAPPGLPLRLDTELRQNPHYDLCRSLGQLGGLHLCHIGTPAYEAYCQATLKEGRRLGDIKPRSLSSRTDWRSHFSTTSEEVGRGGFEPP